MKHFFLIITLTALATVSDAALVVPDSVTLSGAQSKASSGSLASRTMDGSGLSATLTEANLATVTHANGFSASQQYLAQGLSSGTYDAVLSYTFNTALEGTLTTIAVWNYSQSGQPNRSADSVTISVDTGSGLTSIGTFVLTQNNGTTAVGSDLIDVSSYNLQNVTQVAISLNQTKKDSYNAYTTGLSEVAFQTTDDIASLPSITIPPQSATAALSGSHTFTVTASGSDPLSYQWWKDAAALSGKTASSLLLENLTEADEGNYSVVVANTQGSVTSSVATLTVETVPLPDKATLLFVHAHPDDEFIFGGGVLPHYAQARQLPVAVVSMVTRNQNGSYPLLGGGVTDRIAELHNALDVYAGQSAGSGSINAMGYYETGNITMIEGGLRDSGSYNNRDATKAWEKWDGSLGNSDGLADGRYAAAYTVARAIRLFRPEVVVTCHDLEGDYGHADHTGSSVATTEGYELAANASVDIDGLPAWQAKKLYLRGNGTDNRDTITYSGSSWGTFSSDGGIHSLFHDYFEETSIGGSTPREIADLGGDQHVSQAPHPVVTVFDYYAQFDGHYSEWFTLYRTEVGSDTIEADFTIAGDLTSTTYSGWSSGDFFGNLTIFADRDDDLLSDPWELDHFTTLAAADPTADDDGDGHNNNYEFITGLNPKIQDHLDMQISSAGQTVEFTLPAATGTGYDGLTRHYQLKFSPDLIDWDTVVTEGTADGTTVVYAIPSDLPQGFYRLSITLE